MTPDDWQSWPPPADGELIEVSLPYDDSRYLAVCDTSIVWIVEYTKISEREGWLGERDSRRIGGFPDDAKWRRV